MNVYRYEYHGDPVGIKAYLLSLGFSSSFIKRVKYGGVRINGEVVHMRAVVNDKDIVTVTDAETANALIPPRKDISLRILYENESFIAVFKPSGMPTHPSRGNHLPTLAEVVIGHYSDRPFIFRAVNRLDKDTSGIVIVAKTADAAYRLSNAMKKGDFVKEYDALVVGIPSPPSATIDAPIKRESENSKNRIVASDGKRAVTDYEVTKIREDGNAEVHLVLHTGRTHQIRVHMAHIGHPLYADALYGKAVGNETFRLCASKLTLTNPESGKRISIVC